MLTVFIIIIVALAIYAVLIEPYIIIKKEFDLPIEKIKKTHRIVFMSDLHVGSNKKSGWIKRLVHKLKEIKPDIMLIGGDLIDNANPNKDETKYLEPFKELVGHFPIYYVLGNHEYGIRHPRTAKRDMRKRDRSQSLIAKMTELGIPLLRDQLINLHIDNQRIYIFGTEDEWAHKINYSELKHWDEEHPLILVTHNPDGIKHYPLNKKAPDLVLSGHTHGGQISLPFIGGFGDAAVKLFAAIKLPPKYYRGLNDWNNTKIYISTGLGESFLPIRFFNPPEIVVINLKPQK